MNNPMSLMADAAKLSITQLQQAIKNGTVPPYIGVPLLQQKVKESQQAKQAMAAQQPAQPPVAQGVMQQAQGVDTLPTNLPQQGMAGGGIISFAEGGDTYGSDNYDPAAMEQDYRTNANAQYQGYLGSRPEYGIGSIMANRAQTNAAAELQANTKTPYDDAVKYYKSIGDTAGFATAQAKRSEWLKNPTNLMENAAKAGRPQVATKQAQPQIGSPATTPSANARPEPSNIGSVSSAPTQRQAPSGDGGISGLGYKPASYDTSYIDELKKGDNNPETGKPYTKAELAAERKAEFIAAGGDPDVYKTQKEAAEKAGTKSEARSRADEAAPWFAASKAFGEAKPNEGILGLAGKAIGAAGTEAGAITKADDLRAEATRKELGQIALAQNAYSQAQAVGDREAMQKAEDTIEKHTTLLGSVKMKDTDAINEALKTGAQERTQIQAANIGAAASKYAADKADRKIESLVKTIMADNPKMTNSEAYKMAYEYTMPGFGATAQRDVASMRTELGKQYKVIAADLTLNKDEKARQLKAIQAQIDALGSQSATPASIADTSKFTDRTKYQL